MRGWHGANIDDEFVVPDWDVYAIDITRPFDAPESPRRESRVVHEALRALWRAGILPDWQYDEARCLALRDAAQAAFEIRWSAITPRMQRLIYAINAIHQPQVMVAAGIFCGYTFFSNAGAAAGPGAVYRAQDLIGLEVDPQEAARAAANVQRLGLGDVARIVTADAVSFCASWPGSIDLLYLDADAPPPLGKAVNHDIALAAWDKLPKGAMLLAHNSVNSKQEMAGYLATVRNPANCRASLNVVIDGEGLEVSVK